MYQNPLKTEASEDDHILDDLQVRIESKTKEFIGVFENSAKELTTVINEEFQKKPWLFTSTCIGVGLTLGYLIGKTKSQALEH